MFLITAGLVALAGAGVLFVLAGHVCKARDRLRQQVRDGNSRPCDPSVTQRISRREERDMDDIEEEDGGFLKS